jgi:hypothetical protein
LRAKRRAALANLDTLAQAIFFDLFGDPVSRGSLTEAPKPATAPTPAPEGLAQLWSRATSRRKRTPQRDPTARAH